MVPGQQHGVGKQLRIYLSRDGTARSDQKMLWGPGPSGLESRTGTGTVVSGSDIWRDGTLHYERAKTWQIKSKMNKKQK
ncbi:hypothetical protein VSDG_06666 [Cytospora chrysosperma]|uniref:Uncharacterized protein n=1 Tax=Cytospora chrysosperma TaxID=252740 RepID=A0A423VN99_CYTCH|nr:hypothetical protein VSDG_06666 [Valsa sordida]